MASSRLTAFLHDHDALDGDSYSAHRLKHASPDHLHMTTRRFFIGPIPEGWLNSNRKSWYKRWRELSSYSSRQVSFNAAADQGLHPRTMTGLGGPSVATPTSFSFPQPEDVFDDPSESETTGVEDEEEGDEGETTGARQIEPVATGELPPTSGIAGEDSKAPEGRSGLRNGGFHGTGEQSTSSAKSAMRTSRSSGKETFTAVKEPLPEIFGGSRNGADQYTELGESDEQRPSISNRDDPRLFQPRSVSSSTSNADASSRTPLLAPESSERTPQAERSISKSLHRHDPAPTEDEETVTPAARTRSSVRFKVSEGVSHGHHRIGKKADRARDQVSNKSIRRRPLREGTIVKMERMLVRIDLAMQQLPEDFDENESIRTETRVLEKWREFMVVARKSKKEDSDDFRLQIYKTRVIPEIESDSTRKKPTREIRLDPKTTHVNLYSTLDKTVVIWHPYRTGTRIVIMRPCSTAHSVEWYTFLRDALGWQRPAILQVDVPDLDVSIRLERPFEGLEAAGLSAEDEETAIARTEAEKAIAGQIISQCVDILQRDPEWTSVLKGWNETAKMGLAWKRYDRLEWVYGLHEQKMYGSMAMQRSHDLELRPKQHYPTTTFGKKGKLHEEPPPVEGFLIRLTSQQGTHQRLGKVFFKRLYFSTQDRFLIFNRPAKATPPRPPRLATISGTNIPSSHEIVENTPLMYDVEPFKLRDGQISWLSSGNREAIQRHDNEALGEARRNIVNITASDGYINLCYVKKVRRVKWGASPADDELDPGSDSDVDFHEELDDNTRQEDGSTTQIDDNRTFELVLDNGLVVRLQTFSKETRDEWIKRLKALVKYWKRRTLADMDTYKAVRRANLAYLNIDEEMEAILGQFAQKWEVSRSETSPELYNMCGISTCRTITLSGDLYLKPRRRGTFRRCSVILTGGQLLIYQTTARKRTGEQVKHIHQGKQQVIDLKDCYVYSGLIVEGDLLYQNRTFDANHHGMASLPRIYLEDGWTSADVDLMTCFVVWRNRRGSWFKTAPGEDGGKRAKLRRVRQLGVPGRGMVFKCRSRAERDHWVLSVAAEIERVVDRGVEDGGGGVEVRFEG